MSDLPNSPVLDLLNMLSVCQEGVVYSVVSRFFHMSHCYGLMLVCSQMQADQTQWCNTIHAVVTVKVLNHLLDIFPSVTSFCHMLAINVIDVMLHDHDDHDDRFDFILN